MEALECLSIEKKLGPLMQLFSSAASSRVTSRSQPAISSLSVSRSFLSDTQGGKKRKIDWLDQRAQEQGKYIKVTSPAQTRHSIFLAEHTKVN